MLHDRIFVPKIMFREKRKFKNSRGITLSAIFEGKDKTAPVVIICHGYASSKDSESQEDLTPRLLKAGFSVYRFDFTGCGQSRGQLKNLTPNVGIDDLKSAIKDLRKKKIALYGSSFGGYTALRYAVEDPVLALSLKGPVSDWTSVKSESIDSVKMAKLLKEVSSVNIYEKAKNIECPVLIVHGGADEVVPLAQSRKLFTSLGSKNKKLEVIKGAIHIMRGGDMHKAHQLIANFLKELSF